MCNTTSKLCVEHPRGPRRVQHVQHLPLTGVEQPQTRFSAAAGALAVISKHPWFISVPLPFGLQYMPYVPSAEEVHQHQYTNLMLYVEPLGL